MEEWLLWARLRIQRSQDQCSHLGGRLVNACGKCRQWCSLLPHTLPISTATAICRFSKPEQLTLSSLFIGPQRLFFCKSIFLSLNSIWNLSSKPPCGNALHHWITCCGDKKKANPNPPFHFLYLLMSFKRSLQDALQMVLSLKEK